MIWALPKLHDDNCPLAMIDCTRHKAHSDGRKFAANLQHTVSAPQ